MRKLLITPIVIISIALPAFAQSSKPTPREDLEMAVKIARFLEYKPLDEKAKPLREQLLKFLIVVPDITVTLCSTPFPSLLDSDKKDPYAGLLIIQAGLSQAAFLIENPDRADDSSAELLAGVEGTLRTYEAIRAEKPKYRAPELDELIGKREAGTLAAFVEERATECQSNESGSELEN